MTYLNSFPYNKKDETTWYGCLGILVALIVQWVGGVIVNGWALSLLWLWFVVPVFNAPALSNMQAYGLILLANFFTKRLAPDKTDLQGRSNGYKVAYGLAQTFMIPLAFVGISWIILQFL